MVSNKQLKFACTKCGNCCKDKNTLVNVTYSDILKIKYGLHLSLNELLEIIGFYVLNRAISKENQLKMVIVPIETEKGLAFIGLMRNSNGFCLFYDEKNKICSIYNLRPIFCRTFPFSFQLFRDEKNENLKIFYTEKAKSYCPGIGPEAPHIDLNYWITLGKSVIDDLNKNHIQIEDWNENIKNERIKPSAKNYLRFIFDLIK